MTYQMTVIYHRPDDPQAFDAHYASTHAPLALAMPGLRSFTTSTPAPGPDGSAPEHLVAVLTFDDEAAFLAAAGSDEGKAAVADVDTFATGGALMLTGEVTSWT